MDMKKENTMAENELPTGWRTTTLGEVCEYVNRGIAPKYSDTGVLVLNQRCIRDGKVQLENARYSNPALRKIAVEKEVCVDDIVICSTGTGTLGRVSQIKELNCIKMTVDSHVTIVRGDKNQIFRLFLGYNLRSQQKIIESLAEGSTGQTELPRIKLCNLNIIIPQLKEQKAIAKVLSSFDDKIELLQEQNKTLEETAQTIFKEWFGKYQVGDKLPEGWTVEEIGNLVELIIDYRGRTPKKLGMDWSLDGIPALSAKTIKKGKIVRRDAMNHGSEELYLKWMKDELKRGDILLTSEAPLGEMYYLTDDTKYILSQRLFALRVNKEISSQYLYHFLFSKNGQHALSSRASGSTVEGIRQSELRKVEIIIPERKLLIKASDIFEGFFQKASNNNKEIEALKKTRDQLLPKLMSGQLRVKNI